jgi:hypothetical protein
MVRPKTAVDGFSMATCFDLRPRNIYAVLHQSKNVKCFILQPYRRAGNHYTSLRAVLSPLAEA